MMWICKTWLHTEINQVFVGYISVYCVFWYHFVDLMFWTLKTWCNQCTFVFIGSKVDCKGVTCWVFCVFKNVVCCQIAPEARDSAMRRAPPAKRRTPFRLGAAPLCRKIAILDSSIFPEMLNIFGIFSVYYPYIILLFGIFWYICML